MLLFVPFNDLLELLTELASLSRKWDGGDDGLATNTDDSVDSACEYTLCGMLCLRSRSDEKRGAASFGGTYGSGGVVRERTCAVGCCDDPLAR